MADQSSKIKLIFEGVEYGVVPAAAKTKAAVKSVSDENGKAAKATKAAADAEAARVKTLKDLSSGLGTAGKWMGLFGAATGAGAAAIGAALPAIGSLGLGFGVVALAMKANNAESKAYKAQLEAMKKPLQDLQNTAGKAFLPGVTKFLKDSITLFPVLDGAVSRTGKIMGDTASHLGDLFRTDKFKSDLDRFLRSTEPVTSAIGDSFVKLTGKLVEFGAKMAPAGEGFATFIRDAELGIEGLLDGLAPHAADFKSIFESLGSILKTVLPIVGKLAGDLAGRLAPILRDVAGFIDRNKDAISSWVPWIGQAVVALAGLKIALQVKGWVDSALGAIKAFGPGAATAAEAGGKTAGIAWGKGLVGGLGLAGAGIGGTIILDKILPRDAAVTHGSQVARDMLHEMATVLQGGGTAFQTLDVASWIANPISMAVEVGKRKLMELFGFKPPPIGVDANTDPATGKVNEFVGGVSRTRGVAQLDADASRGNNVLGGWKGHADGTVGTAALNANAAGANSTRAGWQGAANGTVGTARLNANAGQANAALGGWRGSANATVGTARLNANTSSATSAINSWRAWASGIVVTVRAVLQKIGFSAGGPVGPGMATGGPIHGPGTGTSDTAGMFALSNGEYVATAKQVQAAGGPNAFGRLMSALERGQVRGFANGGSIRASAKAAMRTPAAAAAARATTQAAMRTPPAPTPARASGATVVQFNGNTSDALATVIMGMIRQGKIQIKAA